MSHHDLHTLLVATDLTVGCDAVLRAAGALAVHTGADLHAVHVVEEGGGGPGSGAEAKKRREAAREDVARQIAGCLPEGVEPASVAVRAGPVSQEIEIRLEEVSPDLLVLGPNAGSAAGAHFLGSTADRLLRTSRVPCLVVRGELALPLGGIGVPVDLSEPSRAALHLAFRWAPALLGERRDGGERDGRPPLRLLHVGWPVTRIDLPEYEETTLRPQLAGEIEAAREATGSTIAADAEVLWDNLPGQRVCRWAELEGIDLLVVGTHGRSGLPRALLGSMATRLAREAPCSVLLVPPPERTSS
jgi:nucleotide-binding universal stress UspA family protein